MDIDNDFEQPTSSKYSKRSFHDKSSSSFTANHNVNKPPANDCIEEDDWEQAPLWSIDDDTLFYPCGLINHSTGNDKSIFVTWNEDYLLNFRFKKSKRTNSIEMTKVRIPLHSNDSGKVREIHILEFNTLLLMSTGRVYYFSSVKSLHSIDWLNGVRCFAHSAGGFSVIRYNSETQRLLLQAYSDVASLGNGKSTLQQSYDITYDELNIFKCAWADDHYTLSTYVIEDSDDVVFLTSLFCLPTNLLEMIEQVYIFSTDGHVFLLVPANNTTEADTSEEPSYQIQLLCVYATAVVRICLLPKRNLCLVFLQNGSIDIWFISTLTKLRQRQMHHTGIDYLDYDGASSNGDFYYTDGDQLGWLQFQYDPSVDDCQVHEQIKYVGGMLACTWVPHLEQLICLSCNNIFYRITFPHSEAIKDVFPPGAPSLLHVLTPGTIKRLHTNAKIVAEYAELPTQLHAKIESEYQQQQLIGVYGKSQLYSQLLHVEVSYVQHFPAADSAESEACQRTITLTLNCRAPGNYNNNNIYALLRLQLKAKNEIFECALWQLFIEFDNQLHVLRLPKQWLCHSNCLIVVPLLTSSSSKQYLPDFSVSFCTFICVESQMRAIIIPLEVKLHKSTYSALFSHTKRRLHIYDELDVTSIIGDFKQQQGFPEVSVEVRSHEYIKHLFLLPQSVSFNSLLELLKAPLVIADDDDGEMTIYFINNKINFKHISDIHALQIKSKDAAALYYLKLHLLLNIEKHEVAVNSGRQAELLSLVMKYQCEVERCYGLQMQSDGISTDTVTAHLENLQRLRMKLRSELIS